MVLAFKIGLDFLSDPVLLARFTRTQSWRILNFTSSQRSVTKQGRHLSIIDSDLCGCKSAEHFGEDRDIQLVSISLVLLRSVEVK